MYVIEKISCLPGPGNHWNLGPLTGLSEVMSRCRGCRVPVIAEGNELLSKTSSSCIGTGEVVNEEIMVTLLELGILDSGDMDPHGTVFVHLCAPQVAQASAPKLQTLGVAEDSGRCLRQRNKAVRVPIEVRHRQSDRVLCTVLDVVATLLCEELEHPGAKPLYHFCIQRSSISRAVD